MKRDSKLLDGALKKCIEIENLHGNCKMIAYKYFMRILQNSDQISDFQQEVLENETMRDHYS